MEVDDKPSPEAFHGVSKSAKQQFANVATFVAGSASQADDPDMLDSKEHDKQLTYSKIKVPLYILSPSVNIVWLHLLPNFNKQMDFDFQRPSDWSNNSKVLKFNHTEYVSMHNIYDWHNFAVLKDETFLYPSLVVQIAPAVMWYIVKISYDLPDSVANINSYVNISREAGTKKFWKGIPWLHFQRITQTRDNKWHISSDIRRYHLKPDDVLPIVPFDQLQGNIFDHNNDDWSPTAELQHPDVKAGKPFWFTILGFDKYHHTQFTGKHDWDTHGLYWWFASMNPNCQFTKQMTMVMGQAPYAIPFGMTVSICYSHWIHLMSSGVPIWYHDAIVNSYGMVSHQITDMEDRNPLLRHRGHSKYSQCDGLTYLGYPDGIKWPGGVKDMMQLGIIIPGPYFGKLCKHVHKTCVNNGVWDEFPDEYGKLLSLTKNPEDLYNNVPIDSTLKSTIELNHTTLLGCLTRLFQIHWHNMHKKDMLKPIHTRHVMKAYLMKYFESINGTNSILGKFQTKATVFNQMHHAWQHMIEICLCLPACTNWFFHLDIVVALTRLTGLLFSIQTENERLRSQKILKDVLNNSFVSLCCMWLVYLVYMP